MVVTYYVIFMMCLTTAFCAWSWWFNYPPHPRWIEGLGPESVRRYRDERRLTLAVTVFTLVATNGMLIFALLWPTRT